MEPDLMLTQADLADVAIADDIAAHAEEDIEVACIPIHETPVVASATHNCHSCGRLIWVSRRILEALPAHGKLSCLACVAGNASGLN